jgi:hypothetical protein
VVEVGAVGDVCADGGAVVFADRENLLAVGDFGLVDGVVLLSEGGVRGEGELRKGTLASQR